MSKFKFGLGPLALLEWVTEKGPGVRFFTRSDNSIYLYERTVDEEGQAKVIRPWPPSGDWTKNPEARALSARFADNVNVDTYPFARKGLFDHYNALGHTGLDRKTERARYDAFCRDVIGRPDAFHASQTVCVPTALAFSFMAETGTRQLAELRAKREAARAAVERTIVIARTCVLRPNLPEDVQRILPEGATLPLPTRTFRRAYATATVIGETENRLYLADIVLLPVIGDSSSRADPIFGNEPRRYIEKSAVLLDHTSVATAAALGELDRTYADDFQRLCDESARKTISIVTEMHSKMLQKDAEYRDSVQELLSQSSGPKP